MCQLDLSGESEGKKSHVIITELIYYGPKLKLWTVIYTSINAALYRHKVFVCFNKCELK